MPELEQRKFRRGEHIGKPLGGNVAPEPFPQALYKLALSRGYESQLSLSKALGNKFNSSVRTWYTGISAPTPEYLGRILILFQPNDEELDSIIDPYGQLLQEGKASIGSVPDTKRSIRIGLKQIKPGPTPFDEWMESFCRENMLSLKSLAVLMGMKDISPIRHRKSPVSLDTFSVALQTAPQALNLSPEATDSLSEAVSLTIEEQIASSHDYKTNNAAGRIRTWQAQILCKTYNCRQAGRELGRSGEWVRKLRIKLNLPYLLTEADLNVLRVRNTKAQKSTRKSPPGRWIR